MKIEKVNDNQIRCTLTREDLDNRQLKLSELAYGTEKAKSLFREMMQQASYEFGFEAEDIPLMIEAIPLSSDTIILIITKVEYPEELDTRFSKFSDSGDDLDNMISDDSEENVGQGADDILGLFRQIQRKHQKAEAERQMVKGTKPLDKSVEKTAPAPADNSEEASPISIPVDITKLFAFRELDTLSQLSLILNGFYDDDNTLYKRPAADKYCLVIRKGHHTPEDFNKVCNILSEYSHQEKYSAATEAFYEEHYDVLIGNTALQTLAKI